MRLLIFILCFLFSLTSKSQNDSLKKEDKLNFGDRIFLSGPYGIYHCIQGQYSYQFSSNFFGAQFKKVRTDGEIGFGAISVSSISMSYGTVRQQGYFCIDANYHLGLFPLTLIFSIGAGSSLMLDFQGHNAFSMYPSIFLDLGGIEFSYHYKFNLLNSIPGDNSFHTLKVNLGLCINRYVKKPK